LLVLSIPPASLPVAPFMPCMGGDFRFSIVYFLFSDF
jgi:hypothetical protein